MAYRDSEDPQTLFDRFIRVGVLRQVDEIRTTNLAVRFVSQRFCYCFSPSFPPLFLGGSERLLSPFWLVLAFGPVATPYF